VRHSFWIIGVLVALFLGGCAVALIAIPVAGVGATSFSIYKTVQTASGGSFAIAVDVSKVTAKQKMQLRGLKSIAIWPDSNGDSASLAAALSQGEIFTIIPPDEVSIALDSLHLPEDVRLLKETEIKNAFAKVCELTKADALVTTKAVSTQNYINIWSLKRATTTSQFIASIYSKQSNEIIVEIPITTKEIIGKKQPSDEEKSKLINAELAKNILALANDQQ
jgi:hypothetical protein